MTETFHTVENKPENPQIDYLQGARYNDVYENAFNSWNDYLGLSTLITCTKAATGANKTGLRPGSEVNLTSKAPYFEKALDLNGFGICGHEENLVLGERFADVGSFSCRSSPALFGCSPEFLDRDRALAWRVMKSKLQSQQTLHKQSRGKMDLQVCVFCRNNKESVARYTTHILKGPDGRILCPVLRRYTCPLCGASGDNAHTIKYCPLSKLQANAVNQLKPTRTIIGKKNR